jgi:hypothetical protein
MVLRDLPRQGHLVALLEHCFHIAPEIPFRVEVEIFAPVDV